jgi:hypothetical protein
MSKRKILAALGGALAVLALAGLVTAQVVNRRKAEKRLVTQGEFRQKEKEDATPVQAGALTETQRVHSGLYGERQGTGKSLREQSNELVRSGQDGDVTITTTPGTPSFSIAPGKKNSPLEDAVDASDAVVIATVTGKESHLTENEKYVFTDYEVSVKEVIKDNADSHIAAPETLTVSRPGGKVLLDGHLITVVDEGVKPLSVGDEYLLFLKFIPQTGTYSAISEARSGFKLSHGRVTALTAAAGYARKQEGRDSNSLTTEARAAAASGGARKRGGANE